jgi:glycosyltransferase involved in cell wall biosynthesis
MNICVFSIVTYWHGLRGGMDLHGKHLLERLSEKGHKISVISTAHPDGKEFEEINRIKIFYLKHTTFGSSRKGWKKQSIIKFREIFHKEAIDLVLSQQTAGYGIVKIAKNLRIPFITIMHGYETMVFLSILNQIKNFKKGYFYLGKMFLSSIYNTFFLELPVLRNSSIVIAVSNNVAHILTKRPFINKKKFRIVHYGINIESFKPSLEERTNKRRKLNISDQEQVLLFLSLISKQKGADIAIKAFKELTKYNNLKLIIAGDGEYLEGAKSLAKQLGVESRVIFTGFVPNEDTSKYYNAADIFIFPTLRLESFGIVLAEAMACAKSIIASNIGSVPEVIDDGINGLLISPGNTDQLVQKIHYLLNNKDAAQELAVNARKKAIEKFSLERMVDETIDLFEAAVTEKRQ